jgi:hypothetical protein
MQRLIDEKYVKRRATVGRYASFGSLIIMGAALLFSFTQLTTSLAIPLALWGVVLLGMLMSFVGGYYGERFGGPMAHHLSVDAALKGLDNRFALFQYVLPSPHVLSGPDGVTLIVVRSQAGRVTYADGKWVHKQRGRFFRELAGQERVGRVELEVEHQVGRMQRYLEEHVPGVEVPVRGVVLFTHPDVELDLEEPPVQVFYGKKIRGWLRGPGMGKALPDDVRQQVEQALMQAA